MSRKGGFLSGIGDAISSVAHLPGDVAEGVGAVGKLGTDVVKGGVKAGEFVVEHPGKALAIGAKVGETMLKKQLDPKNLAITAGLLAATVVTGGAAAPALAAEVGAEGAEVGVTAAEGVEAASEGIKAGTEAVQATKAVDTGTTAVKGAESATQAVEGASETAADTAAQGSRLSRGLSRLNEVTSKADPLLEGKPNQALHPFEQGISALRDRVAQAVLDVGRGASEEAPSALRQGIAAVAQGVGRQAPVQLEGMSDEAYQAQQMIWRGTRVAARVHQGEMGVQGAEDVADPERLVKQHVTKELDKKGVGKSSGYDPGHGQTAVSPYDTTAGQTSQGYGGQTMGDDEQTDEETPEDEQTTANPTAPKKPGGGGKTRGQHFWEGSHSQWAGGIKSDYDWRKMDPMRAITPGRGQATGTSMFANWRNGKATDDTGDTEPVDPFAASESPAWDQPAPLTGTPLYKPPLAPPKPITSKDTYMSTGQQPVGSALPSLTTPNNTSPPANTSMTDTLPPADAYYQAPQNMGRFRPGAPLMQPGSRTARRTTKPVTNDIYSTV